jgi:hypothetical protein
MRGRAQVVWRLDPMPSSSGEVRCGSKTLLSLDGSWEATLRDGLIHGALSFQNGLTVIPFVAEVGSE